MTSYRHRNFDTIVAFHGFESEMDKGDGSRDMIC